jgi:hypothetical protein
MEKKLKNLMWSPKWTSHMGSIKGCLDYLKLNVSDSWVFGATGHAFLLNIHEAVCPSGPTAWNTTRFMELGKNIGYETDGVYGEKNKEGFEEKKAQAWESTKKALDDGLPCYGWELEIPEYYVVFGYDDTGYFFSGADSDTGEDVKPWNELGETNIGMIEMYSVRPVEKSDDAKTVKEALEFALEYSKGPEKWIFPKYKTGLAGYDQWIKALEEGEADQWGMPYNSVVWHECRTYAVGFLKEAKEKVDSELGPLFDEAIRHYKIVSENLEQVTKLFPFPPKGEEVKDAELRMTAVGYLEKAREAEASGLAALENIASRL